MIVILLSLYGCKDPVHETIPRVYVDFNIYPNSVQYAELSYYGGHLYFTGGVRGVIVFRVDERNFVAYDRACPHDWSVSDSSWLEVDDSGLLIVDKYCGSTFNILNGAVIKGPSRYPLKWYRTAFDGFRLRVYN